MHAPLSPAFRSEWCSVAALEPIAAEWRALAARALEPNVFYEPAFALAAAPVFGANVGAVLVRTASGKLAGLFPARIGRWRGGLTAMLVGWTHSYAPLGTPLIDRDEPEAVIAAWLDYLGRDPAMPAFIDVVLLRNLQLGDARADLRIRRVKDEVALDIVRSRGKMQVSIVLSA